MSWICPECEYENDDMLVRCICGHEIREQQADDEGKSIISDKDPDHTVTTRFKPHEISKILTEQVEIIPPGHISLKFWGTSPVCGIIDASGFELRNRRYYLFSLCVYGKIYSGGKGSVIELRLKKPKSLDFIWAYILRRYQHDKKVILDFLKEWIEIEDYTETTSSLKPVR